MLKALGHGKAGLALTQSVLWDRAAQASVLQKAYARYLTKTSRICALLDTPAREIACHLLVMFAA